MFLCSGYKNVKRSNMSGISTERSVKQKEGKHKQVQYEKDDSLWALRNAQRQELQ